MIARWKPVHLGHAPVLRGLCSCARHALIGIGSANRYNSRNPFTVAETSEMIGLVLDQGAEGYTIIPVPDLDDGPRWRTMVLDMLGRLDLFVTDNPYVASLLSNDYPIMRPVHLVSEAERVAIDGTMVRREMARGNGWQELVPPAVADYIVSRQLDQRFRREFGLQTLALDAPP
jgi:nicotinamide-nucleotide adenylyltransferase